MTDYVTRLRPWRDDDVDVLVTLADNPNIARNMTDMFPHPYTAEAGRNFIAKAQASTPPALLAIEVNGELAGGIGIHPLADVFRYNAELGYWLAESFWGKGIMTQAVRQMTEYAFENFNITRLFARPYGYNTASQRVLVKAGFILEAKLEKTLFKNGEFTDELIYAVRRTSKIL